MVSDSTEENNQDTFQTTGISDSASSTDHMMFETIKQTVYKYLTRNSHDYIPVIGEFRASSVGTCSRKIILDKDPLAYISEDDFKQIIPEWFRDQITERTTTDKKPEFGPHIAGQVIHEAIQEALGEHIHSLEEEVFKDLGDAKLVGHYDLLVEDDKGDKIVIDIKSTSSNREYLPKENHLRQLMAYQGMLEGIRGALLYVNRNSWELTYVPQEFDLDTYSKIIVKVTNMAQREKQGILPPAEPEFGYECVSIGHKCQYYNFCFPEDDDIKKEK